MTLLDADDQIIRPLHEYLGTGSIEQNLNRKIRGGGSIDVRFVGEPQINFGSDRVQIHRHVIGQEDPLSLGVYLIEAPVLGMDDENEVTETTITLLDKLAILDQDEVTETYGVPGGSVITDRIEDLIESATTSEHSIEPSDKVMPQSRTWPPGTPKLEIINDLLDSLNYFSLSVDRNGVFQASPYVSPDARAVRETFTYGAHSQHLPTWRLSQDWFGIPNQIVLRTRGTEEEEGLTAVWQNTDPDSPYSIPSRGRVISLTEDVDAVDQATLDALAVRRGRDVSSRVTNIEVSHAIKDVWPNDLVRLQTPAYDGIATVQKWSLSLSVGAQMQAGWREVRRDR